jgi:hypothetical protein
MCGMRSLKNYILPLPTIQMYKKNTSLCSITQDEDRKNKTQHTMCWTPQKTPTNNVTPTTLNTYFHTIPICMRN